MKVDIIQQILLPEIPSSSGIEIISDLIYIIGDDAQFLFVLNNNFEIIEKIKLFDASYNESGRIPKASKADLEALTVLKENGETFLLALGSGSIQAIRDVAFLVALKDHLVKKINLTPFYDFLREILFDKNTGALNIEGAVFYNEQLYLFQRGNILGKNCIITISWNEFLHFEKTNDASTFHFQEVSLPVLDGISAGFSGACLLQNSSKVFITASVENTSNAIDDGPSSGSYIGILDLNDENKKVTGIALLEFRNTTFTGKVESISIINQTGINNYEALAVCDEDGNPSQLLRLKINLT